MHHPHQLHLGLPSRVHGPLTMKYIVALLAGLGACALSNAYLVSARQTFWFMSGAWWLGAIVCGGVLYFWGRK